MTKLNRCLALLVLVGCGDTAGPGTVGIAPVALSIIAGDGQADTVGATLDVPVTVEVRDADAALVADAVVNFVVPADGCGMAFAGSAATNENGRAADLWVLGTKAGPCTMEVRAVTADGVPQVFGSLDAEVLPGAVDSAHVKRGSAWIGETIALDSVAFFADAHGNRIPSAYVTLVGDGATLDPVADGVAWYTEREFEFAYSVGRYSTPPDAARLAWLQDLRPHDWTISYACANSLEPGAPDSISVDLVVDSVVYNSLPGPGRSSARGRFYYTGPYTLFDGADTVEVVQSGSVQFRHAAGTIDWTGRDGRNATSLEPLPDTYTGGDWCMERLVGWGDWLDVSPSVLAR